MTVEVPVWLLMLDGAVTLASIGVIYKALGSWRRALAREIRLRRALDVLSRHILSLENLNPGSAARLQSELQAEGLLEEHVL